MLNRYKKIRWSFSRFFQNETVAVEQSLPGHISVNENVPGANKPSGTFKSLRRTRLKHQQSARTFYLSTFDLTNMATSSHVEEVKS